MLLDNNPSLGRDFDDVYSILSSLTVVTLEVTLTTVPTRSVTVRPPFPMCVVHLIHLSEGVKHQLLDLDLLF